MKNDYKNFFLIIFSALSLILLADFQISLINSFNWGFNVFLILIIFFVLNKNIYHALFLGWFGGFLIDTAHFSVFGINSLILLFLTAFLAIFQKKVLIITKTGGILLVGITGVFFYRFLEWSLNIIFISRQEKFSFYFLNTAAFAEAIFTTLLLLVIFSFISKSMFFDNIAAKN